MKSLVLLVALFVVPAVSTLGIQAATFNQRQNSPEQSLIAVGDFGGG